MVHTAYITSVSGNTTLSFGFDTYMVDSSSGSITLTLPSIPSDGSSFLIKRTDSSGNTVTLQGSGGQLINGVASITLSIQSDTNIHSYNNGWYCNVLNFSSTIVMLNSGGNVSNNQYIRHDTQNAQETLSYYIMTRSGIIKNLYGILVNAPTVGASRTFTVRKNMVNTTLAIIISGASTTASNTNTSITVVAGDLISVQHTISLGSPTNSAAAISIEIM